VQSDREKEEGLPVAPFMDREKVTKPTAQIGFIKFVLLPMFETMAKASILHRLILEVTDFGPEQCFHCLGFLPRSWDFGGRLGI